VTERSALEGLIRRKNLEHYRNLLTKTQDGTERKPILTLLAEEETTEPPPLQAKDIS
jgi:hypothetical protein